MNTSIIKKQAFGVMSALLIMIATFSITIRVSALPEGTTAVDFDLTPLSVDTPLPDATYTSVTDDVPSGDWSINLQPGQKKSYGYILKLPASAQTFCDGSPAKVAGYSQSLDVKSANPASDEYGRWLLARFKMSDGDTSTLDDQTGTFDDDSTTSQGSIVGFTSYTFYFETPISYADFNSDQHTFFGYVGAEGLTTGGVEEYTAISGKPSFKAVITCGSGSVSGSFGGGRGGAAQQESAKSPKTGAGEVLLGTFLIALIASSFVVYKAIEKHRKRGQVSEK